MLGVNEALRNIKKKDFILTLNNDTAIDEYCLYNLIKTANNYPDTIIFSTCYNYNNKEELLCSGVIINWLNYEFVHRNYIPKNERINLGNDVLPRRGTLVPFNVLHKTGDYDYHNFPHYLGDYDYTIRAKNHGFYLAFYHSVKIFERRELIVDIGKNTDELHFERILYLLTDHTPLNFEINL